MNKERLLWLSQALFFLGFFTCTWDRLAYLDLFGFTLKIQQALFGISFACTIAARRDEGWRALVAPMRENFALCFIGLVAFYGLSTFWSSFHLKTFLYTGWLFFNLATIWWNAQLLVPSLTVDRIVRVVWAAICFHSAIILIDNFAFQYGYRNGFIGFNQDEYLRWGVSRPHAFANEPSFIASFLSLGIIYSFAVFFQRKKVWQWLLPALLCFLGLATTTSRTGLICTVGGLGLVFLFDFHKRGLIPWRPVRIILGVAVAAASVLYISTPQKQKEAINNTLVASVARGQDGSKDARMAALSKAYSLFTDTGGLGVGLGASYNHWVLIHPDDPNRAAADDGEAGHELIMSIWGQVLAEGGIIGFALFAAAIFFLVRDTKRGWWERGTPILTATLVSEIIFCVFIGFLVGNIARGDIWVWFAIWSATVRLAGNRPAQDSLANA
jgi:hypothetical protein